jgi:hypothetical protein
MRDPKQKQGKKETRKKSPDSAPRADEEGKTFLRYKRGDEKARTKALNDAKRDAEFLLDFAGIKGKVKVATLAKAK